MTGSLALTLCAVMNQLALVLILFVCFSCHETSVLCINLLFPLLSVVD